MAGERTLKYTEYQQSLAQDLVVGFQGTLAPLVGWKGLTEFFRSVAAPPLPGALEKKGYAAFIKETYFLVRNTRPLTVYRGYEAAKLVAPYGKDDASYLLGLVPKRKASDPDGLWWTSARPALAIEDMGLSSMHREAPRAGSAIKKEWNRLDYYIEAELGVGALSYFGRAAPQQDEAAYGGRTYGGGDFQFLLTQRPELAFRWMKRYATI
jgi:hypothetical protein